MKYEEMTVSELRAETKKRGLPQQANGKKFTKPELIERLKGNDMQFGGEEEAAEKKPSTKKESAQERKIEFATNYTQIVKKYSGRKPQEEYDSMAVGDLVVFVHHVDAADGNVYRKIRQAKIIELNRMKEQLTVEMLLGGRLNLVFDDILYIRKQGESLPADIRKYLRYKRSRTGQQLINERLVKNNGCTD